MEKEVKLRDAIALYLEHLKAQGKNERTLYTYGKDLEQIQSFFGSERLVQSISLSLVGKFLKSDSLLKLPSGRDRAPQTVKKTMRVFRMLMIWLYEQGIISDLPLSRSYPMGRNQSLESAMTD
jgi:site-specific recombinase XerD